MNRDWVECMPNCLCFDKFSLYNRILFLGPKGEKIGLPIHNIMAINLILHECRFINHANVLSNVRSCLRWVRCFPYKSDFLKVHCAPIRCPAVFLSNASRRLIVPWLNPLGCIAPRFVFQSVSKYALLCFICVCACLRLHQSLHGKLIATTLFDSVLSTVPLTFMYNKTGIETRSLASFPHITFSNKQKIWALLLHPIIKPLS